MHLQALRLQTLSVLCNEEHSPDHIDKKRIHSKIGCLEQLDYGDFFLLRWVYFLLLQQRFLHLFLLSCQGVLYPPLDDKWSVMPEAGLCSHLELSVVNFRDELVLLHRLVYSALDNKPRHRLGDNPGKWSCELGFGCELATLLSTNKAFSIE